MADREYFAAMQVGDIAPKLYAKVDDWRDYLLESGRLYLWKRAYEAYYKGVFHFGQIQKGGEQGELQLLFVNELRNLVQHMVSMITQNRLAWDAKAENSDAAAQQACIIANSLLERDMRKKRVSRLFDLCTEKALVVDEGWIEEHWNANAGSDVGVNPLTGKMSKAGDLEYICHDPWHVIRDFTKRTPEGHSWKITEYPMNRWDLVAQFPDLRDKILGAQAITDEDEKNRVGGYRYDLGESEEIWVYKFMHERSPALPDGREILFLGADCILLDGPLPYQKVPLYRMTAADQAETIHGYTVVYDLLPLQNAENALFSTCVTNQAQFGIANIWIPKGHGLSPVNIPGAMNVLEGAADKKPEPLNLLNTSPEIFNMINLIREVKEVISGLNSVVRGNPAENIKSGNAMALLAGEAVNFMNGLNKSYVALAEDVGSGAVEIYKSFATSKQVVATVGKSNRTALKSWTGDDLKGITGVEVDVGSAISRTLAGRLNAADQLLANGKLEDPDDYITVMETGQLDPAISGKRDELLHITSENEELADGIPQTAVFTDDHQKHVLHHKHVLASPEARRDPKIVQAVLDHMNQHFELYVNADPRRLAMMGFQPPPPPAPAPGPGAPGLGPPAMNPEPPAPGMPGLPNDPMSGAPPPGGPANGALPPPPGAMPA